MWEGEEELEAEYPLGDGTAETAAWVACPYCGAVEEIGLDPGSGSDQRYVEDCPTCCRPWEVTVHYRADGSAEVRLATDEE